MQNCYRKGRVPQNDSEVVEDQNGRLTTKHIHTLKFLQDVVNENKNLKARVDELEAQLSKCAQLHVAAEETQERVKKMKADFLRRTDEINQLLLEKHKIEVPSN
ncbi:hypothetical protein LSAT2_026982 [Lamellibrachia satsuma]|nr:hypothetical protein LSAT2_026982 [Lamellibrachia satsuma]